MTEQRDYRLDLLRVIAISMIVLMHSPNPDSNNPSFFSASMSYVTASGLVLFFMISGSLLLGTKLSAIEFIKRRFSKILYPTLFWTVAYLMVSYLAQPTEGTIIIRKIVSIPFSAQGHGVLWFIYTLAGLYLLAPILSRWLRSATKKEIEFYLSLWVLTLAYPYLDFVVDLNESETGILYYFTGYVGYFILGYYLKNHYRYRLWQVLAAFSISVLIPVTLYSTGTEFDFNSMLGYLSLPVASMAFCWYVLVMRTPNKRIAFIGQASKLSFGVYFVHILIMKQVIWKLDVITEWSGVSQILTIALITIFFSYIFSWLISRLPYSKFIIGI